MRKLAKEKRKADALKMIHKTDEELHEMAEQYAGVVGSTGNIPKSAMSNIAKHIDARSLARSGMNKIKQNAEVPEELIKAIREKLIKAKGK